MYKLLVRRRIRDVFDAIGRHDLDTVLSGLADDVHHRFAGVHPLGGERHTKDGVAQWFDRLYRLFPDLSFEVHRVAVLGWPADLTVAVEWTAAVVPAVGDRYLNRGAHVLRVQRGRVTHLHAYEDSQAVAHACRVMAEAGVAEAAATPIQT